MDRHKCFYCGSAKGRVIKVKNKYSFFGCDTCLSLSGFFLPPSAKDYTSEYYGSDEVEKTWFKPLAVIFEAPRKRRASWTAKNAKPGAGILDVGCGNGQLLMRIYRSGNFLCTGIELGETAFKRASANAELTIYNTGFESLELQKKQDIVLSVHSFEHLENPLVAIEKISNMLTDDGKVFFAFPNAGSWQYRFFGKNWLHLDPPFHAHIPSRLQMVQMMTKLGYVKIHERHFNAEQNVPGFIQSFLNLFTWEKDILFIDLKNRKQSNTFPKKLRLILMLTIAGLLLIPAYIECMLAAWFRKGATIELAFRKK